MSRTFAVSTGAENTGIPTLALPISMACWFKPGVHLGSTIFGLSQSVAGTGNWLVMAYDGGNRAFWEWAPSGTGNDVLGPASAPGLFVDGYWNHYAGTATSLTSKTAYVNGVAGPTFTTSVDIPGSMNRTRINGGYFSGTTPSAYVNGDVAMCTIWNGVALTANEVASLASGTHPLLIQTASIVDHYNITGYDSPELDTGGGARDLTLSGTVPKALTDPPISPLIPPTQHFPALPIMR